MEIERKRLAATAEDAEVPEDVKQTLLELREIGATMTTALPELRKKAFCQFMVDHLRLDLGVLGQTGCGSSSLVNSLLGLKNQDERASPTGVTETTMEALGFPHPELPNVWLWDLPGMGRVGELSLSAQGRMCYLVLSKADLMGEGAVEEVRRWSEEALGRLGLKHTTFLVSALHPGELDFPRLQELLCSALASHRKAALVHYVVELLESERRLLQNN
uniref:IRG-type G domain-containing protein n=1 Tax=Oncorhynchus tshawytscha TaxID=74940 RepID=A0AAZ3P8H7_ONCTS